MHPNVRRRPMTAASKSTLRDRLAAMNRPRPNFPNLDDPNWVTRFIARSGIVEGDDGEVVKARGKRRQIFRERDITRAIAGHMKAGLAVAGTKIGPDGSIVVITGAPEKIELAPDQQSAEAVNEWDAVL